MTAIFDEATGTCRGCQAPWVGVATATCLRCGATDQNADTARRPAAPEPVRARIPRNLDTPAPPPSAAARTLTERQRLAFLTLAGLVIMALVAEPVATLIALVALVTLLYAVVLVYRLWLFKVALSEPQIIHVAEAAARTVPDDLLPTYTVLVPAYGEPELVAELVARLHQIDYPSDRLDVKLLLEEDDEPTIEAATAACDGTVVQIIKVPASVPRTKPKALNHGLRSARGTFVTVYDAEDRPDPLQLRRAVCAFEQVDDDVACLQARLAYHNPNQNLITKWFAIEYAMWFRYFLPGLVTQHSPLPLGGTSNHFRTDVLLLVAGWDAYNVTEDADLGVRLHRLGYQTQVLDSVTDEEANSDFVNWVRQRSRWYKGYLQTWLVHMRNPVALWREVGTRGLLSFNLFVGGTPVLALVNPIFWALTFTWFLLLPSGVQRLFPGPVYYLSLVAWTVGNFVVVYSNVVAVRESGRPSLIVAALLSPLYWVMMSIAAVKAVVQLAFAPSFWEKTVHGLAHAPESASPTLQGGAGA